MDIQLPQHDLLLSPFCSHSVLTRQPLWGYRVRKSSAPICGWALQSISFVCKNIFAPIAHRSFITGVYIHQTKSSYLVLYEFLGYSLSHLQNILESATKFHQNRTTATTKIYTVVILIEIALFINKWAKLISL